MRSLVALLFVLTKVCFAQQETLLTVNGESVSKDEFIYIYSKNNFNNDSANTKADIDNYLELFIKFKLKVAEAKSRGMHEEEAFKEELEGYIQTLKKPYLTENKVTERLVEEAYERYKWEINASHLLINIEDGDTLKAYNKANELKKRIQNGESFEQVARENSDDPSVKFNGGNLGYFTSFQMVYPFESAAYTTPVGQVSNPVRTQFGYHLVKVNDKREANGKVQVAHIMLKHKADSTQVRNKIFDIYDQATGGVPWEELVKQHSEDTNSKNTNGTLRQFGVAQMPYPFQETAFAMQQEGSISDPVMTKYGWHILKLIKREEIQTFEQLESEIRTRISKDVRAELNEKALISRLKKENGFKEYLDNYKELELLVDSALLSGNWKPGYKKNKVLFEVADRTFYFQDLRDAINDGNKRVGDPKKHLANAYRKLLKNEVIRYEEDHLEEKYIDYKMLVNEYREGILLFQLMEEEVWNKAAEDSVGLATYYETHKNSYQWDTRALARTFSSKDHETILAIEKAINSGDSVSISKESLYKKYNSGASLTLQTESGLFERGVLEILDRVEWEKGIYKLNFAGQNHLVWIKTIESPRVKKLNEAKGEVISDYQTQLEAVWLEQLKKKYSVTVNSAVLNDVYEELAKTP